jgi:tetraacyldisaccharide 4'-kinase
LSGSWEQYGLRVIGGAQRGIGATLLRAGLATVSLVYGGAMRLRNAKYSAGIGVKRLPRPVISVGNLTTGGTGKTPVVAWLCDALRTSGERPAVLMRGYKAAAGDKGDEQRMLETLLNRPGVEPIVVRAQPDRFEGGQVVLRDRPDVSVFVMDDGFQHRRLAREFDLLLIDATNPFGFQWVLPRGLLREPIAAIARAHAVLITHADRGNAGPIEARVRAHNPRARVYRCDHVHAGFLGGEGTLAGKRYFAFAGIGNPEAFAEQLARLGGTEVGRRWFGDHWAYTRADLEQIHRQAQAADAQIIVTTEKDWAKLAPLVREADTIPIRRAQLTIRFEDDGGEKLLDEICAAIDTARRRV